jgi:molecular chaperone DnaK (HSP70)
MIVLLLWLEKTYPRKKKQCTHTYIHTHTHTLTKQRLIGDAAKNQVAMNASNTVFDAKRLIGRRFSDTVVQADMKHWPFTGT